MLFSASNIYCPLYLLYCVVLIAVSPTSLQKFHEGKVHVLVIKTHFTGPDTSEHQ